MSLPEIAMDLAAAKTAVEGRLAGWREARFARRLWRRDTALWGEGPLAELSDRLGWLDLPEAAAQAVETLASFGEAVRAGGVERVLLLGMGGSSLAPGVFASVLGGPLPLEVLDSTHPSAIAAAEARNPPGATLVVVSSKSGTTIETACLLERLLAREREHDPEGAGRRFVAVTDPGTALDRRGSDEGFFRVFEAPPDVGGRYSALSVFGLAPLAARGLDPSCLVAPAREMAEACRRERDNPGLFLGAAIGELARAGRDKLTLLADRAIGGLPDWIEQLVAESLGKNGRGVIPVSGEEADPPGPWGDDRFVVGLRLAGSQDAEVSDSLTAARQDGLPVAEITLAERKQLGAEMFRWEVAVAAAATVLGVHPFDQPDVQAAKDAARRAMAGGGTQRAAADVRASSSDALAGALAGWADAPQPGEYLAVQAFLDPGPARQGVAELRAALRRRTGLPVTVGFGPRFLHSTGQLHKGGPPGGRFLQLVDRPPRDLDVPGRGHGFAALIRAQAAGDADALRERGRRLLVVDLEADPGGGLARLVEAGRT